MTASEAIALAALALVAGAPATLAADSLAAIRETHGLQVADGKISVSGISSGGRFAVQVHLGHSTKIAGAGIVADGPLWLRPRAEVVVSRQLAPDVSA